MKITIIYDNPRPIRKGLQSDWGFAALVETPDNPTILFDTGGNGQILMRNMDILGINPKGIDEIFISHRHHDHIGGLTRFLKANNEVKIWLPAVMGIQLPNQNADVVPDAIKLHAGIYSTGTLEGIEQSMAVKTTHGLMLIVGCSHPRMENILEKASQFGHVYGIVGGLHSTPPESLQGLALICATHCTQNKEAIQRMYPNASQEGGAGTVIEIT
jgi:7,8-dihydropterin-6-yl-methyl-4-(beta-D-ribofuranosyl)aminobenzene 5'-phosphate synthase